MAAYPPSFAEEKTGWTGYVEWERYPEKKKLAQNILASHKFTPIPGALLIGHRWKEYHEALGLKSIVDFSWKTVLKEKPELIHLLDSPYNGETRRDQLLTEILTPNKYHFIRNHGGVPNIDKDVYELEITGLVNRPIKISLKDLQDINKFPTEQIREYPGDGDELINAPWGEGAIGTAVYRGVSLKKVLKIACGGVVSTLNSLVLIPISSMKGQVYDYAVSVPWRKVRQSDEVILAWKMNGVDLPKIHGYPLRVVGRWLTRVNARSDESDGPVQSKEYLYYNSNGFSIQQMPVSSAIISPVDKQVIIHDGFITLRERVEVSPDGGHVWHAVPQKNMTEKHYHAWRLWTIDLPVEPEGWLEFCVRTWDSSNNTEPTFVQSAWNVNSSRSATAQRLKEIEDRGEEFEPLSTPVL
ncbi:molybdopterin binding oxidoreductase [Pleurotus eryngii]|uniref:Molybdopterin binding oxidoreductase n=1 Tax=Pleurotus eryngii TaxID=5323 RepID=A0A9P6D5L7_PLEER|nr:molybdopterin binding oxidoreductase [Pleurotus eryngii]